MPSKKKKYNARFPPARIKKIMQTDEEVGKVAAAVPVIISRALELFVESLVKKAGVVTTNRNAKTLTTSHIKTCVLGEQNFLFLKSLVDDIPDVQGEDEASACYESQMPATNSFHMNSGRGRKPKVRMPNRGDAGPSHSTADESETWSAEEDGEEFSTESGSESTAAAVNHPVVSSLPSSSIPPLPVSYNDSHKSDLFYRHLPHQLHCGTTSSTDEDYDL